MFCDAFCIRDDEPLKRVGRAAHIELTEFEQLSGIAQPYRQESRKKRGREGREPTMSGRPFHPPRRLIIAHHTSKNTIGAR
jgi:hypothetical protein